MKFTGLVRRIDTLGRVVIPKEIRDYLAIKTDDCLDISVEKDYIILKKRNLLSDSKKMLSDFSNISVKLFKNNIIFTDLNKIILSFGSFGCNLVNQQLPENVTNILLQGKREIIENTVFIKKENVSYALQPVIINGYIKGSVIILRNDKLLNNSDFFCLELFSTLMFKNLEL